MIHAIVLAAGESRRMGRPKALLPYQQETFLGHIISVLKSSTVDEITLVLGAHAEFIQSSIDLQRVSIVINQHYTQGQLSSLIAALQNLPEETDAALLCLVDSPFVTKETVNTIITQYRKSGSSIIVPVFGGKRGHPSLFSRPVFPDLLNAPLDQGARYVLQSRQKDVLEVAVADPGILIRIDTPEDYQRRFGTHP
jgi:molybdenum cofactor cytidylyltransferase